MRLSPVLLAFLTATATLGFSNSARGQTVTPADGVSAAASVSRDRPSLGQESPSQKSTGRAVSLGKSQVESALLSGDRAAVRTVSDQIVSVQTVSDPGVGSAQSNVGPLSVAAPERIAQTESPTAPAPTTPSPIAPAGEQSTPQQETPDQIQITPPSSIDLSPDPTTPSTTPSATPSEGQATPSATPEQRALVAEVRVVGADTNLQREVYRVIQTRPGAATTASQLQRDQNAIFATGYFSDVRVTATDTALGVRITFEVALNPVLQSVEVQGAKVLPPQVVQEAFGTQYGTVLNLVQLNEGIQRVYKWYRDNGYILAQVVGAQLDRQGNFVGLQGRPNVTEDGRVVLEVAEGEIEDIQVRFINKDGEEQDDKGNPIRGRTRSFIVTREFEQKPGDIFNRNKAQTDLQRVFGLGIFEDVRLAFAQGQDPRKVVVVANVAERRTGSIAAGAGISSASGLFGTLSYQQQNLGGNNQKLGAELQVGQRELLFDFSFTDPWIAGDPYRTSYTLNIFRRRTISLIFDGGDPEIRLPNDDRPRVTRTGGGISFSRPLSRDVFKRSEWTASLGLQYQRVSIRDSDGELSPRDELGNLLSFSSGGRDDLFTVQFGAVRDRRNDPLRPTSGSLLRFGTEQSIPIGLGNIFFNRLRGSYSFYIPTQFVRLTKGCQSARPSTTDCPQTLAFNIQGGTVLGDLPPYEAFSLGGSNSVRGYDEGDLAAARSFVQATVEYRFPIFSVISGALFVDAATDFGSSDNVPGNPGGVRGKPGAGIGYGLGVRVQSPLGPIRIDYGFNDQGDSRLHFGIGERF